MTKQEYIDIAVEYFPDALAEVGKLCVVMNEKHNPGEPVHWTREKSNDHWGSWGRHMRDRGKIDPESNLPHDTSWLWRTCAINQIRIESEQ
jgi:hypothetical protein